MCGIAGIWRPRGAAVADMQRMLSAMRHRGPEGAAAASLDRDRLVLGFLALGFTDEPTSLQPLFNEDYSIALVYNGEIYDYEALRDDLIAKGHSFRTRSDSEVLIHLYEEHGEAFFEHLNGEFAFVLWDSRTEQLICARDRFGVKPLFIAEHDGGFAFASEMKALFALGVPARIDPDYYAGPGIGLAECSMTPFQGITQVRPGHFLRVGRDFRCQERYWRPTFEPGYPTDDEVREQLTRAVTRRVGGDVPIALALSSGVDSGIVAALSAEVRAGLTAFTLSYPGQPYDESAVAAHTAHDLGLRFEAVECPIDALADGFLDSIWATEMATNSLSTVARLRLTRAVRQAGFKALAGGEGSDEIFGGYPYFGLEAIWRARLSPDADERARGERAHAEFRTSEQSSRGVFWDDTRAWQAQGQALGYPSVYAIRAQRSQRLVRTLLTRSFRERMTRTPLDTVSSEFDVAWLRTLDPLDATRVVSRSVLGTFAIPGLGDRVEMAHSLEGRVPFLDLHVLNLAYSLPARRCVAPGSFVRKHVLRTAFADRLPHERRAPPKHTYMAPSFRGFAETPVGRELIGDLLSDRAIRDAGILSRRTAMAAKTAWRLLPERSARFAQLDSIVGYLLSVQALHEVFVAHPGRYGHRGPLLELQDRSPHQRAS